MHVYTPIVPGIFVPRTDNAALTLQWRGNNGVAQLGLKGRDNRHDKLQLDAGCKEINNFNPLKCCLVESKDSQTSWFKSWAATPSINNMKYSLKILWMCCFSPGNTEWGSVVVNKSKRTLWVILCIALDVPQIILYTGVGRIRSNA